MNSKLKTTLGHVAAGLAALAMVAGSTAASAQSYRHGGGYHGGRGHHNNNDASVAIAGGIVGLALGAAIAGNNHGSRYDNGYGYGHAPPPPRYYGGYGYARPYAYDRGRGRDCWTTREYDRYRGMMYERTVCR
jgi:hypothetical protein